MNENGAPRARATTALEKPSRREVLTFYVVLVGLLLVVDLVPSGWVVVAVLVAAVIAAGTIALFLPERGDGP